MQSYGHTLWHFVTLATAEIAGENSALFAESLQ